MKAKNYWIIITAILLFVLGIILTYTNGGMWSAGGFVMDYFAAGDFAVGVFSSGIFSVGIFSIGIFSLGIFSLGVFNVGLIGIGLFIIAWKKKYAKVKIAAENEE